MAQDNLAYDYKSFTVTDGNDYDVKAQQTTLFNNVPIAGYARITTSAAITFKVDKTTNPAFSQSSSEIIQIGRKYIPISQISNLYITNTWAATVGIMLCAWADAMNSL